MTDTLRAIVADMRGAAQFVDGAGPTSYREALNAFADRIEAVLGSTRTDVTVENIGEQVAEHINVKWKDSSCQLCGLNTWTVDRQIAELIHMTGNRAVPCVVVVCNNCGNTLLLNAVVLGIVPASEKTER